MKALIVYGGWAGHEPGPVSQIVKKALEGEGFEVEMSETLDAFLDARNLAGKDVIVPIWTMGKITKEQFKGLDEAIKSGVGLAGCHGGMGDAFRESLGFQYMVGGQFMAHPGGIIRYRVHITDPFDPITRGIANFDIESEQYYMHVDPANVVLATTPVEGNGATMPVMWKRPWGKGRVFYSALGHVAGDFDIPEVLETMKRGILWAAAGKAGPENTCCR